MTAMRSRRPSFAFCYSLALCAFFSFAESVLPHPLPFLRYGFANIAVILAIRALGLREFVLLVAVKPVLSSFFSASLFSPFFPIALASSFFAFSLAYGLSRIRRLGLVSISLASSFAYNSMQSALLRHFVLGEFSSGVLAILVFAGNFTGAFTGLAAEFLFPVFEINRLKSGVSLKSDVHPSKSASLMSAKAIRRILTSLFFVFFFNLLAPSGETIYEAFGFPLTKGALLISVRKTLALVAGYFLGMVFKKTIRLDGGILRQVAAISGILAFNFISSSEDKRHAGLLNRIRNCLDV